MQTNDHEGSVFLRHEACDNCGSSDANGVYSDGHTHCFSCGTTRPGDSPGHHDEADVGLNGSAAGKAGGRPLLDGQGGKVSGRVQAIPNRRLDESTCAHWGYEIGEYNGKPCHIANYKDSQGRTVAQKIRLANKEFLFTGDTKAAGLYGQWLWNRGKRIIITEGELDALSYSQVMNNKWPVVSVPNGAQAAAKAIKKAYDYLENFEEIVICFDQDEPGQKAAVECAELLPVGKARIARLPLKDANEMLVAGRTEELMQAFWNAKQYRPDGLLVTSELREAIMVADERGLAYPFSGLNDKLGGIFPSTLITITSGSGLGKTTFAKEIAYHLHTVHRKKVGLIMLEETTKRTVRSLVGLHLNKMIESDLSNTSPEEMGKAFDELFGTREVVLYDHFGSTEVDNILNRIRYMARALDCTHVVLDHLAILISGLQMDDERKMIDLAMTKLRTLVQETGITLFLVSHLKRPSGDKGHEDGHAVSLGHLRGSHSIAQLSDAVIGLQKPPDDPTGDATELVVLKNRLTGERGSAGVLHYSRETGRLTESVF
jgi:twinkle protein